jgi:hypothetical protein
MAYSLTTLRGLMSGKQTRMFENTLRNTRRVNEAAIPVENIQGPILLVSYTRDEVWPSTFMSEQIVQRLRDRSFRFYFEHSPYDAGHAEWSMEACRTNILAFLREQFLTPAVRQRPMALMKSQRLTACQCAQRQIERYRRLARVVDLGRCSCC